MSQKLVRAVQQLQASGASGYSAAVRAVWPDGHTKVLTQCSITRDADYLFEGAGQGCSFVVEAGLFRLVQISLERHREFRPFLRYHDWTLYALARSMGARWHFDSEATMIYHQHGGNDTGARSSAIGVVRRLKLIRTGWYRAQVAAIVQLVLAANAKDASALMWVRISHGSSASPARERIARLLFVARHGRRRWIDRGIQMAAVAFGYL